MTTHRITSFFVLSSAAVMLVLSGCAGTTPGTQAVDDASGISASQAQGVASSAEYQDLLTKTGVEVSYNADGSRVLADNDGVKVELPAQVDRVANLWDANNQVMLMLGSPEKIVATTQQISKMPWYNRVYPKISEASVPVNGSDVNTEELLKAKPDVVISVDKAQVDKARGASLSAVHLGFQDYAGLKKTVVMTAEVIGTDEARSRALSYIKYLEGNLQKVTDKTASLSESERPKVLHIAGGSDVTKVDGSDSIIGEWMKAAGARNSIDGVANYKNISVEQIISSAPDQIIIGNSDAQKGIDTITSDTAWADVPAVKKGKLYRNPVGTFKWDRYSTEEALQILWAAQHFHPELFADINLVRETQTFYRTYYNYELSDEEAQRILAGDNPGT